jgi:hypothetical protein
MINRNKSFLKFEENKKDNDLNYENARQIKKLIFLQNFPAYLDFISLDFSAQS